MTKKQKIVATTIVVGTALAVFAWEGTLEATLQVVPDLDRKIVRKAHRKMVLKTLLGKYTDEQLADDAAMEATLRTEVSLLQK